MPGVALDTGLARMLQQGDMKDAFCTAVTDDSSVNLNGVWRSLSRQYSG